MTRNLTIGRVAAQAGVGRKAVRLYEARGMIPRPPRGDNRYRLYPPDTVEVLRFIKRAQGLGLRLAEIKEVLAIRHQGQLPCPHVRVVLQQKLAGLDQKLADLVELRRELRGTLRSWARGPRTRGVVCPHIEDATPRRRSRPIASGVEGA